MEQRLKVGISIGDFNGIGPEVILKTIQDERIFKICDIIVYGSKFVLSHYAKLLKIQNLQFNEVSSTEKLNPKITNVINCWTDQINIQPGESTDDAGSKALIALKMATEDLINKNIDVLITAPVNKSSIAAFESGFVGQTEYITAKANAAQSMMFLVSDSLKVGLVSNHVMLKEVASKIDMPLIIQKIETMAKSLRQDFGISKPRIAVLGLNPHSGDNGLLGKEEKEMIAPAVLKAKDKGHVVFGPFAADGFFGNGLFRNFDAILAMYHDQGLIPFKTIAFDSGVNFTAGIPVIRTSPDHGTAYDIAGQNLANPDSMRSAIFTALDIYKDRAEYKELTANPLERIKLNEDREEQ